MFYESRTQSSTRHRRLRYFLLLSLRLLVLLLLILAFANPFVNRNTATLASDRLVLAVIDNSFSMRAGTRLADAKDEALKVLAGKGAARAQVAAFGSQLRIMMTQPTVDQGAARKKPRCRPFSPAMDTATSANSRAAACPAARVRPHSHRIPRVQRYAARRPGLAILRHGASRQRDAGDACRSRQSPVELGRLNSVDTPGQVWGRVSPDRFTYKP